MPIENDVLIYFAPKSNVGERINVTSPSGNITLTVQLFRHFEVFKDEDTTVVPRKAGTEPRNITHEVITAINEKMLRHYSRPVDYLPFEKDN